VKALRNNRINFSYGRLKKIIFFYLLDFALLLLAAQNDKLGEQHKGGLWK